MNPFTWFDRFLDHFIGIPALDGADWLAEVEAQHDSLLPDDLWAAHHKKHADTPGDSPEPDVVSVWPADAVTPAPHGVGGFPNELLLTLVDVLLTWGCRAPHGVARAVEDEIVKRFVLIRK